MTRVKRGVTARKRHKKIIDQAKGFYGAKSRVFRVAKQAVIKANQYKYRDRKIKKRTMRQTWIITINAALKKHNMSYSSFIKQLNNNNIKINRKTLSLLININQNFLTDIIKNIN